MAGSGPCSLAAVPVSGGCVLFPSRYFAGAVLACVRLSSCVPSGPPVVAAAGVAVAASQRLAALGVLADAPRTRTVLDSGLTRNTRPGFNCPRLINFASRKLRFNSSYPVLKPFANALSARLRRSMYLSKSLFTSASRLTPMSTRCQPPPEPLRSGGGRQGTRQPRKKLVV